MAPGGPSLQKLREFSSSHGVGGLATRPLGHRVLGGSPKASLGPQGLLWPLLSNLGPKRGPIPEGKDWKERQRGQGPSWEGTPRGPRLAEELPGSNHPQPPPPGPAPMGDGARRSSRPSSGGASGHWKVAWISLPSSPLPQGRPGPPGSRLWGRVPREKQTLSPRPQISPGPALLFSSTSSNLPRTVVYP